MDAILRAKLSPAARVAPLPRLILASTHASPESGRTSSTPPGKGRRGRGSCSRRSPRGPHGGRAGSQDRGAGAAGWPTRGRESGAGELRPPPASGRRGPAASKREPSDQMETEQLGAAAPSRAAPPAAPAPERTSSARPPPCPQHLPR